INHWKIVAQSQWDRLLEVESPFEIEWPNRRKADLAILCRALWYRSLPPPSYHVAWEDGSLRQGFAFDPRVRAILQTFLATEDLQISLNRLLVAPSEQHDLKVEAQEALHSAMSLYPGYFYAASAASILMASDKPESADAAKAAQHLLDTAALTSLGFAHATEPGPAVQLSREQLHATYHQLLTVYSVYLNNWLDCECTRITADQSAFDPAVLANCDALLEELDTLSADSDSKAVCEGTRLELAITALEYSTLGPLQPGNAQVRLNEVCRRLNQLDDKYDALLLVDYLRSRSRYLQRFWTPDMLNRVIAAAGP